MGGEITRGTQKLYTHWAVELDTEKSPWAVYACIDHDEKWLYLRFWYWVFCLEHCPVVCIFLATPLFSINYKFEDFHKNDLWPWLFHQWNVPNTCNWVKASHWWRDHRSQLWEVSKGHCGTTLNSHTSVVIWFFSSNSFSLQLSLF